MGSPVSRQRWSWFVLAMGLVLVFLCWLEPSTIALGVGLVMMLAGLVGVLLGA